MTEPDFAAIRAALLDAGLTEGYEESARALAGWALEYGSALLAAIDELTAQRDAVLAENAELKLDLDAAKHYTTDDLTSPARFCVECREPWPCETVRALTKAVTDAS